METKKYRYTLSTGQKGFCPRCGEMTLSLYIDTQTGQVVDPKVGLCKQRVGCRYHYPPKKYFIEYSKKIQKQKKGTEMRTEIVNKTEQDEPGGVQPPVREVYPLYIDEKRQHLFITQKRTTMNSQQNDCNNAIFKNAEKITEREAAQIGKLKKKNEFVIVSYVGAPPEFFLPDRRRNYINPQYRRQSTKYFNNFERAINYYKDLINGRPAEEVEEMLKSIREAYNTHKSLSMW